MKAAIAPLAGLAAAAAVLSWVGCSGSDPLAAAGNRLVGSWQGEAKMSGPDSNVTISGSMPVKVEFKADGTMTMNMLMTLSGTWKVLSAEGDKLTVDVALEMPSGPGSAEAKKDEREFSIAFEGDDRITMAPTDEPSEAMTLTRQS